MLTLIAIPAGFLLGTTIASWIISSVNTETVRMPLILTSHGYATAVLIVVASAGFSFTVVARRIQHLDLLSVLKARE